MAILVLAASAWRSAPSARAPLRVHMLRRPLLIACSAPSIVPPAETATAAPALDVLSWLDERVQSALVESYGPEYGETPTLLTPATKP
eukprot:3011220-Prymnesium_polylepis.1